MSWTDLTAYHMPRKSKTDNIEKRYYRISEVEEMLGLAASTLRYWESQFSILRPHRTAKGTRFYSPDDLDKIRMIQYLLKDRGFKIEKAQEIVRHNHSGVTKRYEAMKRLVEIRDRLSMLLSAMDSRSM